MKELSLTLKLVNLLNKVYKNRAKEIVKQTSHSVCYLSISVQGTSSAVTRLLFNVCVLDPFNNTAVLVCYPSLTEVLEFCKKSGLKLTDSLSVSDINDIPNFKDVR